MSTKPKPSIGWSRSSGTSAAGSPRANGSKPPASNLPSSTRAAAAPKASDAGAPHDSGSSSTLRGRSVSSSKLMRAAPKGLRSTSPRPSSRGAGFTSATRAERARAAGIHASSSSSSSSSTSGRAESPRLSRGALATGSLVGSSTTGTSRAASPRPNGGSIPRPASGLGSGGGGGGVSEEVKQWLKRLKLSKPTRTPRHDFANGYLAAEILHRHFGSATATSDRPAPEQPLPPLRRFDNPGGSRRARLENWESLLAACRRAGLGDVVSSKDAEAIVSGKPGAAEAMLQAFYDKLEGPAPGAEEPDRDKAAAVPLPVEAAVPRTLAAAASGPPRSQAEAAAALAWAEAEALQAALAAGRRDVVAAKAAAAEAAAAADGEEDDGRKRVFFSQGARGGGGVESGKDAAGDVAKRKSFLLDELHSASQGRSVSLKRVSTNDAGAREAAAQKEEARRKDEKREVRRARSQSRGRDGGGSEPRGASVEARAGAGGGADADGVFDSDYESDEEDERAAIKANLEALLAAPSASRKAAAAVGRGGGGGGRGGRGMRGEGGGSVEGGGGGGSASPASPLSPGWQPVGEPVPGSGGQPPPSPLAPPLAAARVLAAALSDGAAASSSFSALGGRLAAASDVAKGAMLGRGRFACVFAGTWTPAWTTAGEAPAPVAVAVKEFMFASHRKLPPLGLLRLFLAEANTLARLQHPKVAGLVAAVVAPRPMLLLELLSVGSLFDCMHGSSASGGEGGPPKERWRRLPLRLKLGLAVDVAEGLAHLHAHRTLHGDMKSHNVLVGLRPRAQAAQPNNPAAAARFQKQLASWGRGGGADGGGTGAAAGGLLLREAGLEWVAKVGDLGTAAALPTSGRRRLYGEVGTTGWMAPEVLSLAPPSGPGTPRPSWATSSSASAITAANAAAPLGSGSSGVGGPLRSPRPATPRSPGTPPLPFDSGAGPGQAAGYSAATFPRPGALALGAAAVPGAPIACANPANPLGARGYGLEADVWSFGIVVWETFGDHLRPDPFAPSAGGTGLWRGGGNPFAGLASEDYVQRLRAGERWPLTLTDDDDPAPAAAFGGLEGVLKKLATARAASSSGGRERAAESPPAAAEVEVAVAAALRDVCVSCWRMQPANRPTMATVCQVLQRLADALAPTHDADAANAAAAAGESRE